MSGVLYGFPAAVEPIRVIMAAVFHSFGIGGEYALQQRDVQHHARAIPHEQQQEQALRHVAPAGDDQGDIHRVNGGQRQRDPDMRDAEYERVAQRPAETVLEPRLEGPHPFETDDPQDGEREFGDEQRRDL